MLATLIPALLIGGFGLVICMFSDQSKIIKNAGPFNLMALGYYGTILHGLWLIFADYYWQHHHNHKMMSYMFYLNYICQFGGAFLYSVIFRSYTIRSEPCECDHHGYKTKRE